MSEPELIQIEIVNPNGTIAYRRPEQHPDIAEALKTTGYSVRMTLPDGNPGFSIVWKILRIQHPHENNHFTAYNETTRQITVWSFGYRPTKSEHELACKWAKILPMGDSVNAISSKIVPVSTGLLDDCCLIDQYSIHQFSDESAVLIFGCCNHRDGTSVASLTDVNVEELDKALTAMNASLPHNVAETIRKAANDESVMIECVAMLKVGVDKGDDIRMVLSRVCASFAFRAAGVQAPGQPPLSEFKEEPTPSDE